MPHKSLRIIGLTGPIASGKDEAAKILKKRGAVIIDADRLAHALYSPEIDRKKLARIVFSDKKKLRELNRIIHPHLKKAVILAIRHATRDTRQATVVVNAAVLKEIGLIPYVDEVWVVTASREKRLKRLLKKGIALADAKKRMNSQLSLADYIKIADIVIKNEGTIKQLRAKVQAHIKF